MPDANIAPPYPYETVYPIFQNPRHAGTKLAAASVDNVGSAIVEACCTPPPRKAADIAAARARFADDFGRWRPTVVVVVVVVAEKK